MKSDVETVVYIRAAQDNLWKYLILILLHDLNAL